jgi:hypothetical protein
MVIFHIMVVFKEYLHCSIWVVHTVLNFKISMSLRPCMMQGSFFGVRIRFLASEGDSLHKYTNQSQSLRILQLEKRTLV